MNWNVATEEGMANAAAWTQNLINSMSDKGVWCIPRSGMTVSIDKATKTATITSLLPDSAIPKVFKALGWTVVEPEHQKTE